MSYLDKTGGATVVSVRLTEKGREFLAKGFKDDNVFDIVKFSLGDSEIDYGRQTVGDATNILAQLVTEPTVNPSDLKSKLYASGVIPTGEATISLTTTDVQMTKYQSGYGIGVSTTWLPVEGLYNEDYLWTNIGPLEDYDFGMSISVDTRTATIRTFDTTGTTTVRVKGMTSGKYALFTLTIS